MRASYMLIIANDRVKVKVNLKFVSFLSQYLRTVLRQSLIFAINQLNYIIKQLSAIINIRRQCNSHILSTLGKANLKRLTAAALAKTWDLWYNKINY